MTTFLPSSISFYSQQNPADYVEITEVEQYKFEIKVYKDTVLEESHHIIPKKSGEVGRLLLNLLRIHKII
jgi:hypothetical protein